MVEVAMVNNVIYDGADGGDCMSGKEGRIKMVRL
jgi:hypothetical protein